MAWSRPVISLSVAIDVPGPRFAILAANANNAVAFVVHPPRLVGIDASLSGEHAARGRLAIYDKSGTTNVSWVGSLTEAQPEIDAAAAGFGGLWAERHLVAREGVANRDDWPDVPDWNAVRRHWDLYVALRANELPTTGAQLKAIGLAHGQSSSWRAQGGGGINFASVASNEGCVAIVDKLSAPARVSVTLYLEASG
jgi:hypothetical protein